MTDTEGKRERVSSLVARKLGEQPKHHPTLYATGRHGCWGFCICGWESPVLSNVMSVHLAFGQHLVETDGVL